MLFTIFAFVAVLAVLVLAHEIGHFITARLFGCKVEEFGFGFPPRIVGWQTVSKTKLQPLAEQEKVAVKIEDSRLADGSELVKEVIVDQKREIDQLVEIKTKHVVWGSKEIPEPEASAKAGTVYSLNWIPLGGFVKIKGEDGANNQDQDSFAGRPVWQRAIIVVAGITMNIVLAAFLLSIGYMIGMPTAIDEEVTAPDKARIASQEIQIYLIKEDSPAKAAGVEAGDIIVTIDGQKFTTIKGVQDYLGSKAEQKVSLVVRRVDQQLSLELKPKYYEEIKRAGMGVALLHSGVVSYPWYLAILKGFQMTGVILWLIITAFYNIIKNLIMGQPSGVEVTGPVGIAVMSGQMARMGFAYIIQFVSLLSLNLAIINLIPFPALDGGHLLFLIIEKVKRGPVNQKVANVIHNIGFILLMLLMVFITYKDVVKWGSGLWQKFFG